MEDMLIWMRKFEETARRCNDATTALHQNNNLCESIKDVVVFEGSGFRMKLLNPHHDITHLSVIYPSDAMGNRGPSSGDPIIPSTMEIALFNNDKLIYVDELGYSDVNRFYEIDDLITEIRRIATWSEKGACA